MILMKQDVNFRNYFKIDLLLHLQNLHHYVLIYYVFKLIPLNLKQYMYNLIDSNKYKRNNLSHLRIKQDFSGAVFLID
jgi:hypothetical protein